jgi:hypothetical protein
LRKCYNGSVLKEDIYFCLQDERYSADETCYDWYQDFSSLYQFIQPYLKDVPDYEILVAGCGNSSKHYLFLLFSNPDGNLKGLELICMIADFII